MKRFFVSLLLVISISSIQNTWCFALNESEIILSENPVEENTQINIGSAKSLEKYLISYKEEIISFQNVYGLTDDPILKNGIKEVTNIIFGLRKIQTNKIEKSLAEAVLADFIAKIKNLNKNIKKYFENKSESIKEDTRKYQDVIYATYIHKFSTSLDRYVEFKKIRIAGKRILSKNETLYKQRIANLEFENKRLKNFDKFFFKTKRELLVSLKSIILKIKKESNSL